MAGVTVIRPYGGVGAIDFGMTVNQVEGLLGKPVRSIQNRRGEREEFRSGTKICYSATPQVVTDIVLMPPAKAIYDGVDLFQLEDPVAFLSSKDSRPLEYAGTRVFLEIGLAVTGFEEVGDSDSSITAFVKGRWEHLANELKPVASKS